MFEQSHIDFSKFCVGKKGKSKYNTDFGIEDFYKYYSKTVTFETFTSAYSNPSTGLIVNKSLYKKILKEYFDLLADKLLSDPDGILMSPLGFLQVTKKRMDFEKLSTKPGGLKIDYKASKEAGRIVYHLNEHRSYCAYRIGWQRPMNSKIFRLYNFKPTRQLKRRLAKILITDPTKDFFETS